MPRPACAWQAPDVVELDPITDGTDGVPDAFEAAAVNALLFQRPNGALDHAVLLRAMQGDFRPY